MLDISIAPLQVHYYSAALLTTVLIPSWSEHAEVLQATASGGLAQGPYVAARVEFKPTILWTQDAKLTTKAPRPTTLDCILQTAVILCSHIFQILIISYTCISSRQCEV